MPLPVPPLVIHMLPKSFHFHTPVLLINSCEQLGPLSSLPNLLISFLLGDGLNATKELLDSGALRAVLDATNKIYNTASQRKVMLAAQMKQDSKLQNLVKQLAWFMVNICRQTENMDLSQEDVKDIYRAIAMFVNDTDNLEFIHQDYSI